MYNLELYVFIKKKVHMLQLFTREFFINILHVFERCSLFIHSFIQVVTFIYCNKITYHIRVTKTRNLFKRGNIKSFF